MRDIYEAVEKLSVVLAMRVANSVRKRGWANKAQTDRFVVAAPDGAAYPTRIVLPLPLGGRVSFTPEPAPAADGSWKFSIRRTDGVVRHSWADGITLKKGESEYQLFSRDELLSESVFSQMIDELSASGLSGHAAAICRAYIARFGAASADIYEILFLARHMEQLERMHDAVLTGASQLEVESELGRLAKWQG